MDRVNLKTRHKITILTVGSRGDIEPYLAFGNVTTPADPSVVEALKDKYHEA